MRQQCEKCGRSYNDEHHSTMCPHRGIGFCAVCDCVICLCRKESCRDYERSNAAYEYDIPLRDLRQLLRD